MAGKNRILGTLGKYLLFGALLTGIGYQAANAQNLPYEIMTKIFSKIYTPKIIKVQKTQTDNTKIKETQRDGTKIREAQKKSYNEIHPTGYLTTVLTTAGDGVFAKSYVNKVEISPNSRYNLRGEWKSRDKISYSVIDVKKGLKNEIRNYEKKHFSKGMKPSGEEKATLAFYKELYKKVNGNDKKSLKLLENAVRDGVMDSEKDSLYKNGESGLEQGLYMVRVKTKSRSFPVLLYFRKKSFAEVEKESRLEKEVKGEVQKEKSKEEHIKEILEEWKAKAKARADSISAAQQKVQKEGTKKDSLESITKYEEKMFERWRAELKLKEDSIAKAKAQLPDTSYVEKPDTGYIVTPFDTSAVPDTSYAKEVAEEKISEGEELSTRFGLEAAVGTNREAVLGGFVEFPLNSWLSLEGYGNYFVKRGKSVFSDLGTQVTQRDRQLIGTGIIGPTYKYRVDEIHTTAEERAIADIGAGITFKIKDNLEFPLRIGAGLLSQQKTLDGKNTISFERKGQQLQAPSIITNTEKENPALKGDLTLSAGARYNLTKKLSVGASFNRIGKKNSGRLNLRHEF